MQGCQTNYMMHSHLRWCRDDNGLLMDIRLTLCSCTSTQLNSHLALLQVCPGQRALPAAPWL